MSVPLVVHKSTSVPLQFLSELLITQYLTFAGYTILTYDYILTLDFEVEYIWRAPWNPVKIIFLLNRYITLLGQVFLLLAELGLLSHGSAKFCIDLQWFTSVFILFSAETTRILLLLRAWALWKCSFRVAISLVSVYVLYILVIGGYASYILLNYGVYFVFQYLLETNVCIPYSSGGDVWIVSFVAFLLDTGVFGMVSRNLYILGRGSQLRHSPLLRLLVRDALLFYAMTLFHNTLVMMSVTVFRNDPRFFLEAAFSFPLLNVVGQRVVLNLRGVQSHYAVEHINHDANGQPVALQSLGVWRNSPRRDLESDEQLTRSGMTSSYELEVMGTHMDARAPVHQESSGPLEEEPAHVSRLTVDPISRTSHHQRSDESRSESPRSITNDPRPTIR